MSTRPILAPLSLAATLAINSAMSKVSAQAPAIRTIVLVHGAFADGSSYAKVIPLLSAQGYHVVAVQNPLSSLADDVAATKRAIALQDGPVILVGTLMGRDGDHGGGQRSEGRRSGVHRGIRAGRRPVGDDVAKPYPAPPGNAHLKPDAEGWLSLTRQGVDEDFVPDLPPAQREVVYATQGPWNAKCLNDKITTAAWKTKPSWFIIVNDRMIPPEYERAIAA